MQRSWVALQKGRHHSHCIPGKLSQQNTSLNKYDKGKIQRKQIDDCCLIFTACRMIRIGGKPGGSVTEP
jgi:hypothetical protein